MTPWALLQQRVQREGSTPLVTHYDDETGERVELSAISLANWVAKTANLLIDDLDAEPADVVTLDVPAHWQSYVVGLAVSATGGETGPGGRILVAAEENLDDDAAADTVVLSLRPMGAGRLQPGPGVDYATEIRRHGDYFPGGVGGGGDGAGAALVELAEQRARQWQLPPQARILAADPEYNLVDDLLVPLVVGGSVVLVRNEDAGTRERRLATERVTHVRTGETINPV